MTRWMIGMLVGVAIASGAPCAESADEQNTNATVVKNEDGLRFKVPSDWPVEKRGSIVAPIPVEEYLSKKFSAVETRLRQLEQQMASFDLRLRVIEEAVKEQNRLRSSEAAPSQQ